MFGKLKGYHRGGNKVFFEFEKNRAKTCPSVEIIADNIVNVFADYDGGGHRSRAIEGELGSV